MRERKPAFTARVLRGLISATSSMLAGESDGYSPSDWKEIEDADQWLRRVREWKANRKASRG